MSPATAASQVSAAELHRAGQALAAESARFAALGGMRGTSGNQMSQQINKPMRPMGVSNTGNPVSPGVNQSFSKFHKCAFRYLPMNPSGPKSTAVLNSCMPSISFRPAARYT